MRTSTTPIDNAIDTNPAIHLTAKLETWKSRVYFSTYNSDNVMTIARPVGDTDNPLPEAIYVTSAEDQLICATINYDNEIVLQAKGHSEVVPLIYDAPVLSDQHCRPGIYENFLFYYDAALQAWYKAEIDVAALVGEQDSCLGAPVSFLNETVTNLGSIYPLSETEAIFLYIDEGSVRPVFIDTNGIAHESPARFIDPTASLLEVEDDDYLVIPHADLYKLHKAGAVKALGDVFVYFTSYRGSVSVIRYDLATNGEDGIWSDILEAFPEDLSRFDIANAFTYNDRIYLCGRFVREEEFASSTPYTLFCWSIDGFIFSLDRKTLVTTVDLKFYAAKIVDDLVFWSTGRFHSESAPYQLVGENADSIVTKIVSLSGDSEGGWSISVVAGSELYLDNTYLRNGAYALLSIGVNTTAGVEWIRYHEVIISSRNIHIGDGSRSYTLTVAPDGFWHTSIMTHPLYMEVFGKQALLDEALALENLSKSGLNEGVQWTLACDVWSAENATDGGGLCPQTHAGLASNDWWGPDLTQILTDYPVFGDDATYEIRVYGWSRAGEYGTAPAPNPPDPTPVSTDNDDFYALVLIEDDDGDQTTVVSTLGELSSTYAHPPQSYFEDNTRDGSYPVVYEIANPGEGRKIIKLGIRIIAPESTTTYLPERIEMPGISANYINTGTTGGWELNSVDSKWKLVDTISLQITDGNDADGDLTIGAFNTQEDYVYLVAIVGEVAFTRDGTTEYIQDADFVASITKGIAGYLPLSWDRIYPPGTGPAINSSVKVTSGDHPYFSGPDTTWDDNIPPGTSRSNTHVYTFHIDESARLENSAIDARYVPYVYGNGSPLEVALYLEGTGAITEIVDGLFTIYVFESPIPFDEFKGYGGEAGEVGDPGLEVFDTQDLGTSLEQNVWHDYIHFYWSQTDVRNATFNDIRRIYIEVQCDYAGILNYADYAGMTWSTVWGASAVNNLDFDGLITSGFMEGYTFQRRGYTGQELVDIHPVIGVPGVHDPPILFDWSELMLFQLDIDGSTNGGNGNFAIGIKPFKAGGTTVTESVKKFRWWMETIGPGVPQVPVPPSINFTIPSGNIDIEETKLGKSITNKKKGVPQALLAIKPYTAFNFDVIGRYRVVGAYSIGGLIGMATDSENFLVGYIRAGTYGIAKIRDGQRETIIEQATDDIEENKIYDVRFWHRDGLLGIEVKPMADAWPVRGSGLLYEWQEDDGAIATNDDIYHVGVYSIIDPPKFKIVGYRQGQPCVPVLPLDINPVTGVSDFLTLFPASGQVDIDGIIYNYTGVVNMFDDITLPPMGPYQHRNITDWQAPFNADLSGGHTYQTGLAMELTQFNWWEGSSHADDFAGAILGVNSGYNWTNDETMWKVWITTRGIVVYVRNRARHYSDDIVFWYGSLSEKIYLTNGLTGVTAETSSDETFNHTEGAFCFVHSEDEVELTGFTAANGDHSQTITTLLEKFCKVAGTNSSFPGDNTTASITLDNGEGVNLQ